MIRKMKNVKKILLLFIVVVLILGIVCVAKAGFNYGIEYKEVTELKFMLGQVLVMEDVNGIVNKVFGDKEVKVQKIDYFNDSVNIKVVAPTDEEIQTLVDKFNERYNQNNTLDTVAKVTVAHTPFVEIVKPYVFPSILVLVLVAIYMGIRYKKQGVLKTVLLPIFAVLVVEALLFSVFAIMQIPITIWTMPAALGALIITLTLYAYKFEKNM